MSTPFTDDDLHTVAKIVDHHRYTGGTPVDIEPMIDDLATLLANQRGRTVRAGLTRADRVYSAIVGREPEPWGGCDEREAVERVLDVMHAEVKGAVEEFRVCGAYCIDCGNPLDDWRGHGSECAYRDEEDTDG